LIAAKNRAEENNRLKSAFLSNMSHEIRTPMNAIMGFSSLMLEVEAEEKNIFAEIVLKSSQQLLQLIDDVILLSRLQSEKMKIDTTNFSPAELISDIKKMFMLPEMNKGLDFEISIPEKAEKLTIQSDKNKIRQVITNFASNAVKYTEKGSIELGFELCRDQIEFFVKDTGIGIYEDEQLRIFDTFYRGEQAISSAIRGTGLGLNIAKELVNLLGGLIGVSSIPSKGSRFYFTVPLVLSPPLQPEQQISGKVQKEAADFSILIAEDEQVNFQLLKIILKGKIKVIDHAINGKMAVELAEKNRYNLILMDLKMPVMGGIEATKILKALNPRIPVIAQTAYSLPEEKKLALDAGCDDFLTKPIKKETLMAMIDKFIVTKIK